MTTRIVKLQIENFKRIVAVTIEPDGSMVVIGGKNGAGKTSTLDAIMEALGGKRNACSRPLREGADHGEIVVELDDLVVTRTFTAAGGGGIKVTNAEGFKAQSPQKVLDALVGKLTFDPLDFSRMKEKEQASTLKALVGIDTADLDDRREKLYAERTEVNRTTKNLAGQLAGMEHDETAPDAEVSASDLLAELSAARATTDANEATRRSVGVIEAEADDNRSDIHDLEQQVNALKEQINRKNADDARLSEKLKTLRWEAAELVDIDLAPIEERIAGLDQVNARVRQNVRRTEVAAEIEGSEKHGRQLTEKINDLDADRADMIGAADFPVDGLGFDENGVTLNGLPFDQASSAEQLRVSVAMGAALNPKLRVLLVRDGSLLDEASMEALARMAEEHDLQVWLERVGDGDEVGVLIEEGRVAERRAEAAA